MTAPCEDVDLVLVDKLIRQLERPGRVVLGVDVDGPDGPTVDASRRVRLLDNQIGADAGRRTDAQAVLARFLSVRNPGDASDELPLPTAVALLEVATLLGVRAAAAALAEPLQVAADLVAADGTLTVIARHLAAACVLNDQHVRARAYAEQALRVAEEVGFRPEAALARLQLAELELAQAHTHEARRLLEATTPELDEMQMRPALERATAMRSRAFVG